MIWKNGNSLHILWESKTVQLLWKRFDNSSNIWTQNNRAIPLPNIYPRKQKQVLKQKLIAALFRIAKKWKQPKVLLTYEWVHKMWYVHTRDYYTDKRMKVQLHPTTWMNLHYVKWRELDKKGYICYMVYLDEIARIDKLIKTVLLQGVGRRGNEE